MSTRPKSTQVVNPLQSELEALRTQALLAGKETSSEEVVVRNHFSELNSTEVAAASLGVSTDELRPISFMNESHFETLLKTNALSDGLARRLDAYRTIAKADGIGAA